MRLHARPRDPATRMRRGAGRAAPLDGLEVEDHVGQVQADHAEDAAARARDRQAVVLERRAEEVACARAAQAACGCRPWRGRRRQGGAARWHMRCSL